MFRLISSATIHLLLLLLLVQTFIAELALFVHVAAAVVVIAIRLITGLVLLFLRIVSPKLRHQVVTSTCGVVHKCLELRAVGIIILL